MVLQKQRIELPFAKGLDTKTADEHDQPPTLSQMDNGEFDEVGIIKKRNGYLAQTITPEEAGKKFITGSSLFSLKSQLLMMAERADTSTSRVASADGWQVVSLDDTADEWRYVGRCEPLRLSVNRTGAYPFSQGRFEAGGNSDLAHTNGYLCTVFQDGTVPATGEYRVVVVEESTGTIVLDQQFTGFLADYRVWVVSVADSFHIFTHDKTSVNVALLTVDTAVDPATTTFVGNVITDHIFNTDHIVDVTTITHAASGAVSVVAYRPTAASRIYVEYFDEAGTSVDTLQHTIANDATFIACSNLVQAQAIGSSLFSTAVQWQDSVNDDVYSRVIDADGSPYGASDTRLTTTLAGQTVRNISSVEDPAYSVANRLNMRTFIEVDGGAGGTWDNYVLQRGSVFLGGSVVSMDNIPACGMASRAFINGGKPRIWVVNSSTTQSGLFLMTPSDIAGSGDVNCSAKAMVGSADGIADYRGGISHVIEVDTDDHRFATMKQERSQTDEEIIKTSAIVGVKMDGDGFDVAQIGSSAVVAGGGFVADVDRKYSEASFHLYPECKTDVDFVAGGNISDGVYSYKAVYKWIDRNGQVHRSAPSDAYSGTAALGGASQTITIGVKSLVFGEPAKLDSIAIELYREASDGIYHYTKEATNDRSTDTVDIVDIDSDAMLLDNEALYTTGGLTDNMPPPASTIIAATNDRVWVVDDENRSDVWPSKSKVTGAGLAWSDLEKFGIQDGGDLTALAAMDGKIFFFKADRIFAMSAAGGPNIQGIGAWSPVRLVTGDAGCVDRQSLVRMDRGLMFKSGKGIYLLTRQEQLQYIGAAVEEYNDDTIKRGTLVADKNQVRFLLDSGVCLCFDYLVGQWSVWTNHDAVDATIWAAAYCRISNAALVLKQDTSYRDNVTAYSLKAKTSWYKTAGLQGAQRIWWVELLMRYVSAHTLNITIRYDYVDSDAEKFTFEMAADGAPHQVRFKPARQRCQAFQILVWDSNQASSYESLSLVGLSVEVGVDPSKARKLRASKTL